MPRGRPKGRQDSVPCVPGFHSEAVEAAERGVTIPALRRQRAARIGPLPAQSGRHSLYPDGSYAAYLQHQFEQRNATPPHRGRPPKYPRRPDA